MTTNRMGITEQAVKDKNILTDLRSLILSEIGDFFAGFGHPGEPETPEEMQRQLIMRVGRILNTHIVNYSRAEVLAEILKECRIARDEAQAELLAYREAAKKPVFFVTIEGEDWVQAGRIEGEERPDLGELPDGINYLYAAPPIQAVTVPDGWIECSERLPKDDTLCLAIDSDGVIWSAHYDDEEMRLDGLTAPIRPMITHWMPLPAAPLSHAANS